MKNNNNFYYGHKFDWLNTFRKTGEKNSHLRKGTLQLLTLCIHHKYRYTKQPTFSLNHKILKQFDIDRRLIRPYLETFRQAGLLKYEIKKGKSPLITLLFRPK